MAASSTVESPCPQLGQGNARQVAGEQPVAVQHDRVAAMVKHLWHQNGVGARADETEVGCLGRHQILLVPQHAHAGRRSYLQHDRPSIGQPDPTHGGEAAARQLGAVDDLGLRAE